MKGLKIAVIGAGSTYTPELISGFIERKDQLPVASFYLMDIDRGKLDIVGSLAKRMIEAKGMNSQCIMTENLAAALDGADCVVAQIRVGKMEARIKDERIPLKYGLIGQETTGIGGFMKGMRTIPVIMDIVREMKKYCPEAWLINFSNPSGLIAEAIMNHTDIKMIGLCNVPINMRKSAMKLVGEIHCEPEIDYVGLNHLSWITGVYGQGDEYLQAFIDRCDKESYKDRLTELGWEADILKTVRAIPSPYLKYFYCREEKLEALSKENKSRGEICVEIEKELLSMYRDPEQKEKPAALDKRGGALYSEAAVSLISAIYNDKNEIHVVNTKNKGVLDFMGYDDVIEISCRVNKNGVTPLPLKDFNNQHIMSYMQMIKAYEKHASLAGLNGDYEESLRALLIHPLAGDFGQSQFALKELMDAHKGYLPQFK